MEYRQLGQAGVKVSEIALGGWLTFGEQIGQERVNAIVDAAIDGGVNYVDLADVYAKGEAERVFGNALRNHRRQDLVIASKVYWPMGEGPNDRGLSRKHIMESIDGSLQRLGVDYLDLYFCHRHDPDVPLDEIAMAMDDLIRQGKVLYWGTSVWPAGQLAAVAETARQLRAHPPRAEQPRYNMLDRHIEREIMDTAKRYGMGLVVWSPLAHGVLTGKYSQGIPEGSRLDTFDWIRDRIDDEEVATADRLGPIAQELGCTQAQLALAWCLRKDVISSVITGASKPEQVKENLRAVEVELDDDVLERIEDVLDNKPEPLPG